MFGARGPGLAADLGSGGGIPGLALAHRFPDASWVLVEAGARRARFLEEVIGELHLSGRVSVMAARAEAIGRDPRHRARYDLVVSRGFGRPSVTAECAAPLLRRHGAAVISEPPGGRPGRWSVEGLGPLGMEIGPAPTLSAGAFQVLTQRELCPERFPRRVGVAAKRPLF